MAEPFVKACARENKLMSGEYGHAENLPDLSRASLVHDNMDYFYRGLLTINETMELPKYALIGSRAVKAVPTEDGGLDVLVYDPERDAFVPDMYFLDKFFAPSTSTEFVTEEQFLELVEEQRTTLKPGASGKK